MRPSWMGAALALGLCACSGNGSTPTDAALDRPPADAPPSGQLVSASQGGTVVSDDQRLTLTIPPGALEKDTVIRLRRETAEKLPAFTLEPDGLKFLKPATVSLSLTPSELDLKDEQGNSLDPLKDRVAAGVMCDLRNKDGTSEWLGMTFKPDEKSGLVTGTGEIGHFSVLVVTGRLTFLIFDLRQHLAYLIGEPFTMRFVVQRTEMLRPVWITSVFIDTYWDGLTVNGHEYDEFFEKVQPSSVISKELATRPPMLCVKEGDTELEVEFRTSYRETPMTSSRDGFSTSSPAIPIKCVKPLSVGGTVTGLKGELILRVIREVNGSPDEPFKKEEKTITADGPYAFALGLGKGDMYQVEILSAPSGQVCKLYTSSGEKGQIVPKTVATKDVTDIDVKCTSPELNDGTYPGPPKGEGLKVISLSDAAKIDFLAAGKTYAAVAGSEVQILELDSGKKVYSGFMGTFWGATTFVWPDGRTFLYAWGKAGLQSAEYDAVAKSFKAPTAAHGVGEATQDFFSTAADRFAIVQWNVTPSLGDVTWYSFTAPAFQVSSSKSASWFPAGSGAPIAAVGGFGPGLVVLTDEVNPGELWYGDPKVDPTASKVASLGQTPRKIRCESGLCAVTNYGSNTISILTWPTPAQAPVLAGTQAVGKGPVGVDLRPDGTGVVAILTTGTGDDTATVTRVNTSDGKVLSSTPKTLTGCTGPGHAVFVSDTKAVASCNGNAMISVFTWK